MDPDHSETPGQPTVWPAFMVVLAAIALSIAVQIAIVIVLTAGHIAAGGEPDPEAIQEVTEGFFLTPVGFLSMAAFGELAFIGCVLVALRRSTGSRLEQLGLTRSKTPVSTYVALIVGTGVPVAVGIGLSWLLSFVVDPWIDPSLIWAQITPVSFVPYILFIALAPGFVEEITFRGFVQRRLTRRWGPRAAIAWSTVLFAVAHVDPHHFVFTLPLGLWFGVIAWRLDVIWPTIACHAALNGLWSIYFIGAVKAEAPSGFYVASGVVALAICIVGFVASWRILARATAERIGLD